jgi:hypothetical protein
MTTPPSSKVTIYGGHEVELRVTAQTCQCDLEEVYGAVGLDVAAVLSLCTVIYCPDAIP